MRGSNVLFSGSNHCLSQLTIFFITPYSFIKVKSAGGQGSVVKVEFPRYFSVKFVILCFKQSCDN